MEKFKWVIKNKDIKDAYNYTNESIVVQDLYLNIYF